MSTHKFFIAQIIWLSKNNAVEQLLHTTHVPIMWGGPLKKHKACPERLDSAIQKKNVALKTTKSTEQAVIKCVKRPVMLQVAALERQIANAQINAMLPAKILPLQDSTATPVIMTAQILAHEEP
jgi:hypothetical protein